MTNTAARNNVFTALEADREQAAQTRPTTIRDDAALDFFFQLMREGRIQQARKHWFEVVEPMTRTED